MTESKQWAVRKTILLTFVLAVLMASGTASVQATVIRDLRIGSQRGYVRMVLESDSPISPPPAVYFQRNRLRVTLGGILNDIPAPRPETLNDDIDDLEISATAGDPSIAVVFAFEPANIQTFSLTGPHRFIVDAYRPVDAPVESRQPALTAAAEQPEAPESYSAPSAQGDPTAAPSPLYDPPEHPDRGDPPGNRYAFQQQLIAVLIMITSIIAIMLLLLIWLGGRRKAARSPWQANLPPERDAAIEDLDKQIREQLKSYEQL